MDSWMAMIMWPRVYFPFGSFDLFYIITNSSEVPNVNSVETWSQQ